MASPVEFDPMSGFPVDGAPPDGLRLPDAEDDGVSIGRLINERRAQFENPEALRLARAL